jgi:hypothetical protein
VSAIVERGRLAVSVPRGRKYRFLVGLVVFGGGGGGGGCGDS